MGLITFFNTSEGQYSASATALAAEILIDIFPHFQDSLRKTSILLEAKVATKERLQERFGLRRDRSARLISFVGRMAEQKGLVLLSGIVEGTHHSTLEELLIHHDDLQILVAGPTTHGDRTSTDFRDTIGYLAARYPGRVAAHFDYIPHSKALEVIFGSSLFLMPSRFEP